MTADDKIVLIRDRVLEAERVIRQTLSLLPDVRPSIANGLKRAADSLHGLDVLMRPPVGSLPCANQPSWHNSHCDR
jgi:hypothetical protein